MYTPGSRIHQDPLPSANSNARLEEASVYRVRSPISHVRRSGTLRHPSALRRHGAISGTLRASGL
eukprot:9462070-Pyramimonas_sp.AAC.1